MKVREEIQSLLKNSDLADRTSLYQLQCFVLGKEPTIQSKLHQCLLELSSRSDTIEAIELEIAEQLDKLALLDIELARRIRQSIPVDEFTEKEQGILIRQVERQKTAVIRHVDQLKRRQQNSEEEALFFLNAFNQLSKREALKQWDDPDVQKEYWNEKLRQEVNLKLLLRQLPDTETMRSILALHDDSPLRKKTLEMLENYNKQVAQIADRQSKV